MTDIGHLGFADDMAFALHLVEDVGVAAVPGSSFYSHPSLDQRRSVSVFQKDGDPETGGRETEEIQLAIGGKIGSQPFERVKAGTLQALSVFL